MSDAVHLVCHYCHGINRVPRERLIEGPKCGKCGQALLNGAPAQLDDKHFDRHIRRNDLPVLVDFWSPTCGPCMMMAPDFDKAAHRLEPSMRLAKVNVQTSPGLAMQHQVRGVPTLVIYKGGAEVDRHVGAMDLEGLVAWAKQHI